MSVRYSPIAPINLLEDMLELEITTGYHTIGNYLLLLAHDVLNHPMQYEDLVTAIRYHYREDNDTFIIMDNSIIELGRAMSAGDVIEAACVVEASCIMTPDAIGGFEETQALVREQAHELMHSNFPLMRVPQGAHYAELVECVNWLAEVLPAPAHIPMYWGIPRWIATKLGSRKPLANYIGNMDSYVYMHLLGMSDNYSDDIDCIRVPYVMGIDSANPMVMGIDGLNIRVPTQRIHLPRGNYWDSTKLRPLSISNVRFMHNVVGS